MIENIIGMELAYINTNHPDFVGGQEGTVSSPPLLGPPNFDTFFLIVGLSRK